MRQDIAQALTLYRHILLTTPQKSHIKWQVMRTRLDVSYSIPFLLPLNITDLVLQVRSCSKISRLGSPPLILGKITTSLRHQDTRGLLLGSLKGLHSLSGSRPDRVPCCGFTANVSCL
jgi:hypothetical protein